MTKDKVTDKVIVNDIQPVVRPAPRPLPVTVTQTNSYGNQETTTTSQTTIKETKEIQTVVQNIYIEKPQLAILKPVSVKNVQYGDLEESTVVLAGEKKPTIQVTSVVNVKTQEVRIISEKVLPIIYTPAVEIKPIVSIRYIPIPLIQTLQKRINELLDITRMI